MGGFVVWVVRLGVAAGGWVVFGGVPCALALAANTAITATPVQSPFEFLEPSVQISADDRAKLDERDVVLHIE